MNLHLHKTVFVNMGEIDLGRGGAPGQQGVVGVEALLALGKLQKKYLYNVHTP